MWLAWFTLILVAIGCFYNYKKTVIIWMAFRLLFNAQIALKYTPPAMSLDFGVAVILVFMFCFHALYGLDKSKYSQESFYYRPVIIVTIISYTLSFAFSEFPIDEGIRVFVKLLIMNFAIIYVFQKVLYNEQDIKLFVKAIILVAFLISILGIYESFFQDNPVLDYVYYNTPHQQGTEGRMYYLPPEVGRGIQYRYGLVRAYSFFGIHIAFGCACAFILGLLLFFYKNKYYMSINPKLFIIAILLLLFGCFTSNSKTAYLGMFIMVLMVFDKKRILNIKTAILITCILGFVYYYFPNYFDNINSLFNEELADEGGGSSIELREQQLDAALAMFHQSPILGNGPGTIGIMKKMGDNSDILGAEGALLSILPERGVVGYLAYLFAFLYFFFSNRRIIPSFDLFFFLLSLFVMEVASGLRDMTLYYVLLLVMRKMCLLNISKRKQVC